MVCSESHHVIGESQEPRDCIQFRLAYTRYMSIPQQGLAFVFVNFASMLYYEPSLACAPKPIHKVLYRTYDVYPHRQACVEG